MIRGATQRYESQFVEKRRESKVAAHKYFTMCFTKSLFSANSWRHRCCRSKVEPDNESSTSSSVLRLRNRKSASKAESLTRDRGVSPFYVAQPTYQSPINCNAPCSQHGCRLHVARLVEASLFAPPTPCDGDTNPRRPNQVAQ